nr:hypothetical protein [Tanacetum cinerariifolium]
MPEFVEDETLEQTKKLCKWEDGDYICRGHILNGMSDALFDVYQNVGSKNELWDQLESKYITKDDSSKKFLFKHNKDELSLVQLGSHFHTKETLKTKESSKGKGKEIAGYSSVDVIKDGKNKNKNKNNKENKRKNDDFKTKKIIGKGRKYDGLPAQNGVAKRKNRHLLEVAHALLFQTTVPKPFWVDAVSTTCFLINRMPSVVLGGNYPYAVLFLTKPLFPVDPKIFGNIPYFPVTTYRHHEENDDLLVYVSPTHVETTKQSAELDSDGPPLKDVSNDVPISAPSEAYGKSDAPSDAPSGSDSPMPSPAPELDLPITLRKGKRTCRYLVSAFDSYDGLSTSSRAFVANLDSILFPKTVGEALAHSGWRAAMIEEMNALYHNGTWALVDLPAHKKPIGCKWVFSVKMNPDGSIARLKARLALHQLDVKNAFLHGDLEKVYMEQPPRKYCLDFLDDTGQIEAKPCDEPMIPKLKLRSEDGRLLHNPEKYRRVVGKLNYLTITHPDIAFPISVISQFLTALRTSYWDAITQILGYLKGTPRFGILYANHRHHIAEGFTDADYAGCPNTSRSSTGYCFFVGGNLVSWKSKKQNVMSCSSLEAEYRAMTQTTCELVWLRNLLGEISFPQSKPIKMWCDNQVGYPMLQIKGRNWLFRYLCPFARISTIRVLIALAATYNLVIHQMDVKTTFLNGDLEKKVYMKKPKGFIMPGNEQKSDKCVYCKFDKSDNGVIIFLYVDDILIFKTDQDQVDKTKEFLSLNFSMKEADMILGRAVDQLEYSRAIGCLMYAMTSTRPDIAYVVGKLEDHTFTTGWVFLLGGDAISWASKKQTCITDSRIEAKFVALAAAGKEARWLRNLIYEIPLWPKPISPISIHCDSATTLAKAYYQIYNGKSRHLGVRHSMVHKLITNGVISIDFVRS